MTDAASLMLDTTSVIFSHTGDGTKTSLGALTDAGNGMYDCKVSARTETGRVAAGVITLVLKTMEQI